MNTRNLTKFTDFFTTETEQKTLNSSLIQVSSIFGLFHVAYSRKNKYTTYIDA